MLPRPSTATNEDADADAVRAAANLIAVTETIRAIGGLPVYQRIKDVAEGVNPPKFLTLVMLGYVADTAVGIMPYAPPPYDSVIYTMKQLLRAVQILTRLMEPTYGTSNPSTCLYDKVCYKNTPSPFTHTHNNT